MSLSGKISRRMSHASTRPIRATSRGSGISSESRTSPIRSLDLLLRVAVDGGIAAGAEGPHHPRLALHDNATRHKALQRLLADGGRIFNGELPDPDPCVRRLLLRCDFRQGGVEYGIPGGCPVVDHKRFRVGVDPIGEGQIHQHGAADGTPQIDLRDRHERAVLVVQQQEKNFLGEGQHGPRSCKIVINSLTRNSDLGHGLRRSRVPCERGRPGSARLRDRITRPTRAAHDRSAIDKGTRPLIAAGYGITNSVNWRDWRGCPVGGIPGR